jgi:hypothetical protein
MKKNIRTVKVSCKSGIDLRIATTKTLSPLILVTALRGLKTRKALKAPIDEPPEDPPIKVWNTVIQADPTITKSKQFQGSLKYAS